MEITVLLFGPAAAAFGHDRAVVPLAPHATADAALAALRDHHATLRPFAQPGAARLAVNHAFAAADSPISPRDEVALISLVSGG